MRPVALPPKNVAIVSIHLIYGLHR
jgi:hypothetical protein